MIFTLLSQWNPYQTENNGALNVSKTRLTSKMPVFLASEPPSRVQKEIWPFPQVMMLPFSRGWNSAASTGSVELWGTNQAVIIYEINISHVKTHLLMPIGKARGHNAHLSNNSHNKISFMESHTKYLNNVV